MIPCVDLPDAKDGRLAALLEHHVETVRLYRNCADRHRALVDALRAQQEQQRSPGMLRRLRSPGWREQTE